MRPQPRSLGDARQRAQQRAADAVAALRGPHEQVFEIQARPADEGREVEEIQRETRRLAVPLGDQHVDHRDSAIRARAGNPPAVALASSQQLLVVGELAHQARDDRRVGARCGSDVQHGRAIYSAMYQRMSLSRSSTKRSYGSPWPLTS